MDSDNKFLLCIGIVVGATIVSVALVISLTVQRGNQLRAENFNQAIQRGADPIAVRCALEPVNDSTVTAIMCANAAKK